MFSFFQSAQDPAPHRAGKYPFVYRSHPSRGNIYCPQCSTQGNQAASPHCKRNHCPVPRKMNPLPRHLPLCPSATPAPARSRTQQQSPSQACQWNRTKARSGWTGGCRRMRIRASLSFERFEVSGWKKERRKIVTSLQWNYERALTIWILTQKDRSRLGFCLGSQKLA